MVRPEVLRKRLQKLDDYLAVLEHSRHYSVEEFVVDPEKYGSAERFLQLSIESIDDMASHIIADGNLGVVNRAADLPRLLHDHGFIDEELMNRWIRMVGFRNILVHDYLEVDRKIVHDVLQSSLEDLRALQRVFADFL